MSYNVYITRSQDWLHSTRLITAEEWRAVVETRPALSEWLVFDDGTLTAKNPSPTQLAEMIALAHELGATVQGEEGERYIEPGAPPIPYQPSIPQRLARLLTRFQRQPRPLPPQEPPFAVGSRVRSPLRGLGTVEACDPSANHGLGTLVVGFDDGERLVFSCFAHGLQAVDDGE